MTTKEKIKNRAQPRSVVRPRYPYANVDVNAGDQDRVNTLLALLDVVVGVTDDDSTASKAKRMLLLTAWHEGEQLKERVQNAGGPARSFFQIEASTAKTAYNSNFMTDDILQRLANCGNYSIDDLNTAFGALGGSPAYPAQNQVGTALSSVDIFGCYLARIVYRTRPDVLPDPDPTYKAEAAYWFKDWHGSAGDSATLQAQFIANCQVIDPYMPALIARRKKKKVAKKIKRRIKPLDATETPVLQACTAAFGVRANQQACNRFVNAVVQICQPSAMFPGSYLADDIVGALSTTPWTALTVGDKASAISHAASGDIVVAGMTSTELSDTHGHVVILQSKTRPADSMPFGSWGTDNSSIKPAENSPISKCFKKTLLPQMHYGYVSLAAGLRASRKRKS